MLIYFITGCVLELTYVAFQVVCLESLGIQTLKQGCCGAGAVFTPLLGGESGKVQGLLTHLA